jgi:hypothetical protein
MWALAPDEAQDHRHDPHQSLIVIGTCDVAVSMVPRI